MKKVAQVWVVPGFDLRCTVRLDTSPLIELRAIVLTPPNHPSFKALLLQCEIESDGEVEPDDFQHWRHLGKALSRLSFSLLTPFQVYCARMLKIETQRDVPEAYWLRGSSIPPHPVRSCLPTASILNERFFP